MLFLTRSSSDLIVASSREFQQQERIPEEWAECVRARRIKLFQQDETVQSNLNSAGGIGEREPI
jgi:hypothetical protein